MSVPVQKIQLPHSMSLDEVREKVAKGARFVTFSYCFSVFFAITLKRFSPAVLLRPSDPIDAHRKKYNLISLIFGWWTLPFGPVHTIRALRLNREGGLDVTKDIMDNLTEEALRKGEVTLLKTSMLFMPPGKEEMRAFEKALSIDFLDEARIQTLVVALFVNTENPWLVIGFKCDDDPAVCVDRMETVLRKRFRSHVRFEYVDLGGEVEVSDLLLEQGVVIREW